KRHAGQLQAYPCDKRMFHPGVCCPPCQLIMYNCHYYCLQTVLNIQCFPFVLSKSLQQVCDHHCLWVNNCIRAQNSSLPAVCIMTADMVLLTENMFLHAVVRSGILRGMLFVIQHLFLIFLRIVFLLGFLVVVFKLLAGYAMFYTFLALVNQTSNEWYKGRRNVCQHCHPSPDHFCGPPASDQSKRWFYSNGVLRNLGVFFLLRCVQKKDN
uniref:Palmitoyltransferase n=1 Tax=Oncorhynchus kisutch TaxID=8019 RepID=A0A8C7D8G6_ONCKI